jgi:hypothetical protein
VADLIIIQTIPKETTFLNIQGDSKLKSNTKGCCLGDQLEQKMYVKFLQIRQRFRIKKFIRCCTVVISVEDYKHRGPGFDSRALLTIFLRQLGLERGPLSLVIG